MRTALYSRVSTDDQDAGNQLVELLAFCQRQGYLVAGEYIDHESGRKGRSERAAFNRLFQDAARRRFDLVLFWSLDRFSREGIRKTIHYLQQLDSFGVRFKSYTEAYLDTDNELVSHILLGVLSYFAELEAKKISERTKAGLNRARANGKQLGRPGKFEQYRGELAEMVRQEVPRKEMARRTGLSVQTVRKYLAMIAN